MIRSIFLSSLVFATLSSSTFGKGTYQEPAEFIRDTFAGSLPGSQTMWIRKGMQSDIMDIMDRKLNKLRLRYWSRDSRFAFILDEIGKEKPITVGLVIDNGEIERIKVLVYREIRGWEVRYPFFTDQFKGATLDSRLKLDRDIDGISGATLSVGALTRLAKLALFFHKKCTENTNGLSQP